MDLKGVVVMGSSSGCGVTLLLVLCLWGLLISLSSASRLGASRQKLEVNKHLNRLNKPPVKTIQVLPLTPSTLFLSVFGFFTSSPSTLFSYIFFNSLVLEKKNLFFPHPFPLFAEDEISEEWFCVPFKYFQLKIK